MFTTIARQQDSETQAGSHGEAHLLEMLLWNHATLSVQLQMLCLGGSPLLVLLTFRRPRFSRLNLRGVQQFKQQTSRKALCTRRGQGPQSQSSF